MLEKGRQELEIRTPNAGNTKEYLV